MPYEQKAREIPQGETPQNFLYSAQGSSSNRKKEEKAINEALSSSLTTPSTVQSKSKEINFRARKYLNGEAVKEAMPFKDPNKLQKEIEKPRKSFTNHIKSFSKQAQIGNVIKQNIGESVDLRREEPSQIVKVKSENRVEHQKRYHFNTKPKDPGSLFFRKKSEQKYQNVRTNIQQSLQSKVKAAPSYQRENCIESFENNIPRISKSSFKPETLPRKLRANYSQKQPSKDDQILFFVPQKFDEGMLKTFLREYKDIPLQHKCPKSEKENKITVLSKGTTGKLQLKDTIVSEKQQSAKNMLNKVKIETIQEKRQSPRSSSPSRKTAQVPKFIYEIIDVDTAGCPLSRKEVKYFGGRKFQENRKSGSSTTKNRQTKNNFESGRHVSGSVLRSYKNLHKNNKSNINPPRKCFDDRMLKSFLQNYRDIALLDKCPKHEKESKSIFLSKCSTKNQQIKDTIEPEKQQKKSMNNMQKKMREEITQEVRQSPRISSPSIKIAQIPKFIFEIVDVDGTGCPLSRKQVKYFGGKTFLENRLSCSSERQNMHLKNNNSRAARHESRSSSNKTPHETFSKLLSAHLKEIQSKRSSLRKCFLPSKVYRGRPKSEGDLPQEDKVGTAASKSISDFSSWQKIFFISQNNTNTHSGKQESQQFRSNHNSQKCDSELQSSDSDAHGEQQNFLSSISNICEPLLQRSDPDSPEYEEQPSVTMSKSRPTSPKETSECSCKLTASMEERINLHEKQNSEADEEKIPKASQNYEPWYKKPLSSSNNAVNSSQYITTQTTYYSHRVCSCTVVSRTIGDVSEESNELNNIIRQQSENDMPKPEIQQKINTGTRGTVVPVEKKRISSSKILDTPDRNTGNTSMKLPLWFPENDNIIIKENYNLNQLINMPLDCKNSELRRTVSMTELYQRDHHKKTAISSCDYAAQTPDCQHQSDTNNMVATLTQFVEQGKKDSLDCSGEACNVSQRVLQISDEIPHLQNQNDPLQLPCLKMDSKDNYPVAESGVESNIQVNRPSLTAVLKLTRSPSNLIEVFGKTDSDSITLGESKSGHDILLVQNSLSQNVLDVKAEDNSAADMELENEVTLSPVILESEEKIATSQNDSSSLTHIIHEKLSTSNILSDKLAKIKNFKDNHSSDINSISGMENYLKILQETTILKTNKNLDSCKSDARCTPAAFCSSQRNIPKQNDSKPKNTLQTNNSKCHACDKNYQCVKTTSLPALKKCKSRNYNSGELKETLRQRNMSSPKTSSARQKHAGRLPKPTNPCLPPKSTKACMTPVPPKPTKPCKAPVTPKSCVPPKSTKTCMPSAPPKPTKTCMSPVPPKSAKPCMTSVPSKSGALAMPTKSCMSPVTPKPTKICMSAVTPKPTKTCMSAVTPKPTKTCMSPVTPKPTKTCMPPVKSAQSHSTPAKLENMSQDPVKQLEEIALGKRPLPSLYKWVGSTVHDILCGSAQSQRKRTWQNRKSGSRGQSKRNFTSKTLIRK